MMTHHSPLHATPELARRVDRAEIDFCALALAHSGRSDAGSLEAGGGRGLYGGPGSPLNKVLGLGLGADVADADLAALEAFYRDRGAPVQIELCPLAQPNVAARLSSRGYIVQAFENELACRIGTPAPVPQISGVRVARTTTDQDDLWIRVTSLGFAVPEGSTMEPEPGAFEKVADVMRQFTHPQLRRYLAWVEGEPAGGASAWVCDGVLGIAGTATVPRFRRRGVQLALTAQAVAEAGDDIDLLIATTAPGSISQRNFERLGFQVLYTRVVFVREAR